MLHFLHGSVLATFPVRYTKQPKPKSVQSCFCCRFSARCIKNAAWATPRGHRGSAHTRSQSQACYPEVPWWKGPGRSTKRRHGTHRVSRKELHKDHVGPHRGSAHTRSRSQVCYNEMPWCGNKLPMSTPSREPWLKTPA